MIKVYTQNPSALKNKILKAAKSKDELVTWTVLSESFKGEKTKHDFIQHNVDQWSVVALFMEVKSNNIIEITSYPYNDKDGVFKSKKPHVEGRFTAALLSNMLDEFNRIEYIKD